MLSRFTASRSLFPGLIPHKASGLEGSGALSLAELVIIQSLYTPNPLNPFVVQPWEELTEVNIFKAGGS